MKVALIVQIPGPMHGKKIPIAIPSFTIGRNPSSTLQADDPTIADQHCVLENRDGKVFLRELNRPGETFVNDARINGEKQLCDGDRLKVGPLLFGVSIEKDRKAALPKKAEKPKGAIKASLLVENAGPTQGKKIMITSKQFTIGRDPHSTLQAEDPSIAPLHCVLALRESHLMIRDLDTSGGTFVNDSRMTTEIALRDGDRIHVGPLKFRASIVVPKESENAIAKPKGRADEGGASAAAQEILKKYYRGKRKLGE